MTKNDMKFGGKILDTFLCYGCNLRQGEAGDRAIFKVKTKEGPIQYFCGMDSEKCSTLNIYRMHDSHMHGIKGTRCYFDHNQQPTPCETTKPKEV